MGIKLGFVSWLVCWIWVDSIYCDGFFVGFFLILVEYFRYYFINGFKD